MSRTSIPYQHLSSNLAGRTAGPLRKTFGQGPGGQETQNPAAKRPRRTSKRKATGRGNFRVSGGNINSGGSGSVSLPGAAAYGVSLLNSFFPMRYVTYQNNMIPGKKREKACVNPSLKSSYALFCLCGAAGRPSEGGVCAETHQTGQKLGKKTTLLPL